MKKNVLTLLAFSFLPATAINSGNLSPRRRQAATATTRKTDNPLKNQNKGAKTAGKQGKTPIPTEEELRRAASDLAYAAMEQEILRQASEAKARKGKETLWQTKQSNAYGSRAYHTHR